MNRKVVNAMYYGVAQSRERCVYLLSRKDNGFSWEFPQPSEHISTMRDAIGDLPSLDPEITDITEEELLKMFPDFYKKKAAGLTNMTTLLILKTGEWKTKSVMQSL